MKIPTKEDGREDAIRPWQYRSWIFPRDPQFEQKAGCVLDLYQGIWCEHPLLTDEYVISADEKTSIQARVRKHATLDSAQINSPFFAHIIPPSFFL